GRRGGRKAGPASQGRTRLAPGPHRRPCGPSLGDRPSAVVRGTIGNRRSPGGWLGQIRFDGGTSFRFLPPDHLAKFRGAAPGSTLVLIGTPNDGATDLNYASVPDIAPIAVVV